MVILMLEHIILGLLMEGAMSGYDVKKSIDSSIGLFYKASFGSLYPALQRLTQKGLVSVAEVEDSSKNKKMYTLLPTGKEAFLTWLVEPLQASRSEHLLRIFFYDYLDEETRQHRLTEYEFTLISEIKRLQATEQAIAQEIAQIENPEQYYYRISVLPYGLQHYEMELNWVRTIKARGK
jgi:DNA-binding PadR family transcriptional regulator